MKRLSNRTIGVDQGSLTLFTDFQSGGEMWTGTGPRERRVAVRFAEPFATEPAVHVALAMIDVDRRHNHRHEIAAAEIGREGFVIVFRTWEDTRVARARASWLAVGELACDDDWDVR